MPVGGTAFPPTGDLRLLSPQRSRLTRGADPASRTWHSPRAAVRPVQRRQRAAHRGSRAPSVGESALCRFDRAAGPPSWRATAGLARRRTTSTWSMPRSTIRRGPAGSDAATPTSDSRRRTSTRSARGCAHLDGLSLRVGAYVKRLDGLVASVPLGLNPDSTIFGNADAGSVKGVEVVLERDMRGGFGVRLAYTLQNANATATDAIPAQPPDHCGSRHGRHHPARPRRVSARLRPPAYRYGHAAGPGTGQHGPQLLGVRPLAGSRAAAILRLAPGCRSRAATPPAIP